MSDDSHRISRTRFGEQIIVESRPAFEDIPRLHDDRGVTHVVTLLADKEGARELGRRIEDAGLEWIWLPVPGGSYVDDHSHDYLLVDGARTVLQILDADADARFFIHCSAGIHRAGSFALLLFQLGGLGGDDAIELLGNIRPVTKRQVGDHRVEWANEVARAHRE